MSRHIGCRLGIGLQFTGCASARDRLAVVDHRLDPEREDLRSIRHGFVQRVAGRESAGQIREPDADGMVGAGILDDGDVVGHQAAVSGIEGVPVVIGTSGRTASIAPTTLLAIPIKPIASSILKITSG